MHILLVDDKPDPLFVHRLQEQHSVEVRVALSFREGMKALQETSYDGIVIDRWLPLDTGMDPAPEYGDELMCYARDHTELAVPVIRASGETSSAEKVHRDVIICGKGESKKTVNYIHQWRSGREGRQQLISLGLVGTRPCGATHTVSRVHELRHDILSPLLPLSNSLQAFFGEADLQNREAFLLLTPASEDLSPASEDFYARLKGDVQKCREKIADLVPLKCVEKVSPWFDRPVAECLVGLEDELKGFLQDGDLERLLQILVDDNKRPTGDGQPTDAYNDLVKSLESFGSQRAWKVIEQIRAFADNLQKVVDFVEFGLVPSSEGGQ